MGKKLPVKRRRKRRNLAHAGLRDLGPAELRQLRRSHRKWRAAFAPQLEAIRASERITAADLAVRINATPDYPPPPRLPRRKPPAPQE